ncbi:unnamed protein product [Vitrella brassicaformis CCMP3155]|uniref:Uncharacterized protein n=1 Tax=Vitrella brassicaformis (strain CCMP3155) TaxID=1169540 RepID=A0A0G4FP96_VITBC|nr:unnamed protein product [Vitrella brassicaformis CCMP3155]|eukprot:CEM16034.1 unnamed protein product [Vitrella brassicaformis CCMP3155]
MLLSAGGSILLLLTSLSKSTTSTASRTDLSPRRLSRLIEASRPTAGRRQPTASYPSVFSTHHPVYHRWRRHDAAVIPAFVLLDLVKIFGRLAIPKGKRDASHEPYSYVLEAATFQPMLGEDHILTRTEFTTGLLRLPFLWPVESRLVWDRQWPIEEHLHGPLAEPKEYDVQVVQLGIPWDIDPTEMRKSVNAAIGQDYLDEVAINCVFDTLTGGRDEINYGDLRDRIHEWSKKGNGQVCWTTFVNEIVKKPAFVTDDGTLNAFSRA